MAGPRITRLNDPANPYNVKKTPTAAPTAAQKATNRAVSQKAGGRTPVAPKARPAASAVNPLMRRANDQYKQSFDKRIEDGVSGKGRKR